MNAAIHGKNRLMIGLLFATALMVLMAPPVLAEGYDNALKGVTGYDVVFDVGQGDPKIANLVFWAVKNAYEVPEVAALAGKPRVAIVFHGPAVKLLSTDLSHFDAAQRTEAETFQRTLRQMKKDGVVMEICLYAAEVMGVDKDTIIPEIDRVGNGFVSVAGYQLQGYALVVIP